MTRKWKRIRSRWAEFISPVRLGCRPSKERVGLAANFPPYSPVARHDFMHNKILLVDDTVISGSYNFSRSQRREHPFDRKRGRGRSLQLLHWSLDGKVRQSGK